MPIEDFLVDFYSKNTDQEIDQVKIDSIVDHYGGDNVSMINDLYEKYDTGNINDDKVLEIQDYYSLDLPEQELVAEFVEEPVAKEEIIEKKPVVKEVEEITEEDWKSTEEDFIKNNNEKLARLYPEFEFSESTFDFNGITAKNKTTGEEESFDLNTNYAGFSDFNEFKDFVSKKPKLDPTKQEIYNKTNLTVDYDDYGDISSNNLYSQIEIIEEYGKPAPFLPQELGVTINEKTRNPKSPDEMLTIVNSIEGIAIDAATNLNKVFPGIRTENESLSASFNKLNGEEKDILTDYVYNNVKEQTGLNLTKDSFLSIYDSGKMQSLIDNRSESIADERIYSDAVKYLGRAEASQEYTSLKTKELKNNLTDKQLNLKELNSKISKVNEQVELLELKKDRSEDDKQRIINFKKEKEKLIIKQKDLGGGAWDESGNWVNTLNVTKKKKEELKQIEENAYNMASSMNMFADEGTDIEKLSARDLSRNLLDNRILETEFLDAKGEKDSISVNLKSLGVRKPLEVLKLTNFLKAKGLDVYYKLDDFESEARMYYSESNEEVGEIYLTYNDLYNLGVRSEEAGGYKGGLDDVLAKKEGEDILNYRIWEEEKLETEAEIRGLYRLVELGENPALIEKPTDAYSKGKYRDGIPLNGVASDIFGFVETGLTRALPEAVLMQWGGYNQEEIETTMGQSPRNLLDQIQQTVSIVNNSESVKSGKAEPIKLTKAQEENFEMGLSEMTSTATFGFVPTLLEFAAFELATGGTATGAAIARLPRLGRFLAGAFKEEVKMQSTTADFGLGTGALFFGLGKVFEPIKFFKKHRIGLNTLMDKYGKAGPAGALSIEGSEIVHGIVDDMLDNSDFNAAIDELYGDTDEATKRFLSNIMMFKLTGAQHFKGRDFKSNHGLGREMNKLNNRSRDLAKQGQRLLVENGVSTIPDNRLTSDGKRIPTTSSDKNFKIQEQLNKLSKENTPEGKKALEILNKLSKVSETMNTVDQMLSIRTQHQSLNPFATDPNTGEKIINKETGEFELNPSFEKNFNNQITKPIFKSLSESAPKGKNGESTFVNPEVLFLKAEDAKMQMQEGNTAEFLPEQNKILVDLSKYTPGKPLHELSHVIFNAYFKKNPQAKINFTNKMREMFKGVDFGTFKDTELRRAIQENYKDKNVQGEEYIAFLTEFLTDPKVYYQNKYTSGTFVNGIKSEIRLIQKQYGLGDFAPPKTAEDLVRTLGDLGREFQKGYVSDVTASQFAALGKIDLSEVEYYPANTDAEAKKADVIASKDLTKEVVVSKSNKEIADANTKIEEKIIKAGDNRVRDIKNQELSKEIKKELSENNIGKATQLANQAAKSAGAMALEPNKRVSAEEFKSGYEEQLARLIETYKPVVDGKRIPFGAYMQKNLKRRYSQILQQAKKGKFEGQEKRLGQDIAEGEKEFDIKSEEATPEEALIASEESSSTGREGITVSKKLGNKADKVVAEIKRKIPVEKELQDKFLEDKNYKSLKDLAAKETQEMFGIKPKSGNLTKSDVKNSQIFINNNPDLFYGLLPKQHTTKRVNVGTSKEPKYVTRPDKATGVQDVLLNAFYNKGTRKDNLTPWTKKPARDVNTSEFLELFGITERGNPNLYVKNSNVSSRIKALVEQTGRIITNQTVREMLPEARLVGEGRSKTMASKNSVVEEIKRIGLKDYSLEKLEKDLKLIASNKGTKRPKEVEDFLIDYKRGEMVEASQETPTFKSESKLFKGTKFKNQDIKFEDIFDGKTGKGVWGQVKKNGKKIYEEYDLPRIEEQIELAIQFAEVFPKAFLRGENLMQTFFMGTRSTANKVKKMLESTSDTPKYVKGTVDPKTGIGTEIGSVASLKNQRDRLQKALGSGKTSKFFKDLVADYKPEGVQKGALKKAMEKASTDADRIEILQKAINKGDNKIKSDLYYAIESAKQEWLYSSKDKNEFIKRAKFIYQGASSNSNLILGSSRQFVPIEAVYFKPGEKFSFEKLKLEHLKSSLKQSMDAARAVVEGRFIEQGRDIMSDYKGIISEKKYLDIIDKIGGTTNNSGLARMTADLNNLKNYRTVESGFKETLYDKIIKETAKEINEKSYELENSFIADQVARYIAEPTPSNEIILKSKIKNKANLRKLKFQNKSVVEEASMASKDLSQSEMLNELNKRDKAFRLGNKRNKTVKKIEVDFDALGISKNEAKVQWLIDKASEGYNDFNFANDAKSNVKAVRDILEQLDVKSQVQKTYASKDLSGDFNKIIEESTGIDKFKVYSDIKAQVRGASAKRQKFFIPPSAEDMLGLLYTTLGKGKKGEAQLDFYKENIFDPYTRAMENLSTDRVNLMSDFKALKKQLDVPKDLTKTTESGFTNEQATRVYLWNKMGEKIPGLSKTDLKELNDIIEKDPKLKAFADQILTITKGDGYSTPKEAWAVGTITTDLIDILNTKKRGKYLETWNQNTSEIFSKDNLNKLEAAYGPKYRGAMENMLARMKSGSNRLSGGNKLSNNVLDYINNSTGAIMFFNTRSAVLQTLSAANFINWGFNNPLRAGTAFANQPQYWKDFSKLMNSDYLIDRRNGLKLNINESEIANAAKTSKNKAKAALNYILEKGYLPTKYADSFAIASGGATFYRNRINDLIKNEGLTRSEAEIRAMKEFRQVSETSQQSSDPSKISSQQASDLGRVVLQFANTPMQYARIQKRAVQDIVNGRGDLKTNISKIAYYAFAQNLLFNALQNGLFALGFGDTDIDEKEEKSIVRTVNGMLDSSLRGLGFAGVTVQVLKNLGIDIYDRSKRDRPEYGDAYKKLLDFSPAIKSKLGKFSSAGYPFETKKKRAEVFDKGFSLDNPAYESMAKVITGTTNLPLDRLYSKVNNLKAASDEETETWQSIAMVLGWPEWQIKGRQNYVEAPKTDEEKIKIKEERSKTRLKAAKSSTDFETLKKLNKQEQLRILKNLGVGNKTLKRLKKLKEADLIEEIIKRNKKKEQ